jgi:uncharacterized protein with PhoU and TrkA domain
MVARDEYLRYAEECLRLARQTTDPEKRARLLEMAQAWRDLGDKAGNLGDMAQRGRQGPESGADSE